MAGEQEKYAESAMLLLTSNLGFYSTSVPPDLHIYLEKLLSYAFDDYARMGIHLTPGVLRDDMDQMIFAAWMYRNGVTGAGKNEMLRSLIRNRQVAAALSDEEAEA